MNLIELKPKPSSFTLKSAKRSFRMNPITLADEVWLDEQFGANGLQRIFSDINMSEIARIAFRFIDSEDKAFFKTRNVKFISEEGEELETALGGVNLLRNLISGNEEKLAVINALLDNIGISRPDADEAPVKKKVVKKIKKKIKKKVSKKK